MNCENNEPKSAEFLREAFATEQECLVSKLKSSARIVHAGDRGEVNEQHFIDFLRKYLPNRYTVEKAIVLDSDGNVSHSIDIVVFDRQYTPTLLDNEKHRYVPAEAVYGVFECKPTIDKAYLEYAAEKAASVRRLKRTSVEINHAGGVFPAKKLFEIVAGILAIEVSWRDGFGSSFQQVHRALQNEGRIDCGFAATGASFDTFAPDGSYNFGPSSNALAYFAFRLLWKLQALATVPAVDWMAYADRLSVKNLAQGAMHV
ncbi:MAG: hypothetical protein C5B50_27355 [Verrucomicrobia bacterium]|nr:MAG: hypothetical protein C5B50_27355 [Verrucomicrobiota bacterium]